MYKKFSSLSVAILSVAITLTACSSSTKESTENSQQKNEEVAKEEISEKENVIKKSEEFAKGLKSTDFKSEASHTKISPIAGKFEQKTEGSVIAEPFASKFSYINEQKDNHDIVIKDNALYYDKYKVVSNLSEMRKIYLPYYETAKNIIYNKNLYDFLKKNANDFNLSEDHGNYVLTYNKAVEPSTLSGITTSIAKITGVSANISSVNVYEANIRFVVTKNYEPLETSVTINYKYKTDNKPLGTYILKTSYSNVNKAADIQTPKK